MKILVLTKYARLGASSRLRFLQYLPYLKKLGIETVVHCLLSDEQLKQKYGTGGYSKHSLVLSYAKRIATMLAARRFDLVWIEKEALQWMPLWLETALLRGTPYVLDYDDAVFHHYDSHPNRHIRRIFGQRLDGLMAQSALVVAGNDYLAQRAREAGARRVQILPTVIDLDRYPARSPTKVANENSESLQIVWIGSPSTQRYLEILKAPLEQVAKRFPTVLKVIGGIAPSIDGIRVEQIGWHEGREVDDIRESDIGVMPLYDSPWERGKCGYKLIQYMACGLPVIASPIGVNRVIVRDGTDGFLAETEQDWAVAFESLMASKQLRERLGAAGRERVESEYCIQKTAPQLAQLLHLAQSNQFKSSRSVG